MYDQAQLDVACAEKERLASEVGRLEPEVEAARKLLGQREADLVGSWRGPGWAACALWPLPWL